MTLRILCSLNEPYIVYLVLLQGRSTLPLTIGHNGIDTVQKSSTTDDSQNSQSSKLRSKLNLQKDQNRIQTSTTTTTTTSSSVIHNEQQSLLKPTSTRKHVRISSNHNKPSIENASYRHTLLKALNASNNSQQSSPIKKISSRLTGKKHALPTHTTDGYIPRMVHLSDNSCWSSREGIAQSEASVGKCIILTQKMLNGSIGM